MSVDGGEPSESSREASGNPLRRAALLVVLLACFIFILSIFMERRTPTSSQAVVQAFIVGLAAEVPGRVTEVGVSDNSIVKAGQILFRIDPEPYRLAVAEAEARLESVGQTIGASTAAVDAAQARVVEATARRDNIREQAGRARELVKRGVYSKASLDEAESALKQADADVGAARAELQRAQQELGPAGADNPQLKEAMAALGRAQLDLVRATVRAPSDGVVTSLQLSAGEVVGVGQAAMTFIDANTIWITAAFKENSLENVAPGNRAEVLFDALPGQLFPARVESVGFGVSQGSIDPSTGLPTIRNETGWIRDPQRFPVRLILDDGLPKGVRYGSQANVVIYTGENPVTNTLGSLWMRLVSVLTYAS